MADEKSVDLRSAFQACVDHSLRSWRYSNFAIHYRDVYRNDRALFQSWIKEVMNTIKTESMFEIDEEIKSRNIPALLAKLEDAKTNCKEAEAWRPSGVPSDDARGDIVKSKLAEKKALEDELKKAEAKEDEIAKILEDRKSKLKESYEKLQNTIEKHQKIMANMSELYTELSTKSKVENKKTEL